MSSRRLWVGPVLLIFLIFLVCVILLYVVTFSVPSCDVRYDFRIKRCSVRLYLQLFVGGLMSYLRYVCLFACDGVQHIVCCGFFCLRLVSCVPNFASFSRLSIFDCPFGIL
jgi:hypothetical protein